MSTVTTSMPIPMVRHARDNRPTLTTLGDTYRIIIEGSARTSSGELLTDATADQRELYAREVAALAATGCTTLEEASSTHGKDSPLYQNARAAARDRRTHKERFPAIIPAAHFDGLGRRTEHVSDLSGLVVIDLGHLDQEEASRTLVDLQSLDSCVLCFLSPSGAGVKALIAVEPVPADVTEYTQAWQDTANFLASHLSGSQAVDPSGKDATRLCFLSHDPEAYLNPAPDSLTPLAVDLSEPEPPPSQQTRDAPPRVSAAGPGTELETDREALEHIPPPDGLYNSWLSWLRTLRALGFTVEEVEAWSSRGENYIPGGPRASGKG